MSDDLNNKLKQLADMLNGNEKMSENLSSLISMLAKSSAMTSPPKPHRREISKRRTFNENKSPGFNKS